MVAVATSSQPGLSPCVLPIPLRPLYPNAVRGASKPAVSALATRLFFSPAELLPPDGRRSASATSRRARPGAGAILACSAVVRSLEAGCFRPPHAWPRLDHAGMAPPGCAFRLASALSLALLRSPSSPLVTDRPHLASDGLAGGGLPSRVLSCRGSALRLYGPQLARASARSAGSGVQAPARHPVGGVLRDVGVVCRDLL